MTYCAVNSIAAVLYICFVENMFLDMESVKAFKQILTATPYKHVVVVRLSQMILSFIKEMGLFNQF